MFVQRNQNPSATNLLTSIQKKSNLSGLLNQQMPVHYSFEGKVAALSRELQVNNLETTKIAQAVNVLTQQQALIGGLQQAHTDSVKVAAALTEAVKLAQDGAIDVSDVFDHARTLLMNGNVKISSAGEIFDQSPGDIVVEPKGPESEKKANQQADALTQTLRTMRDSV